MEKIYPRNSILLLTYNRIDLLVHRVAEIERIYGDRPDVELFIFDNGSTDSTKNFLKNKVQSWHVSNLQGDDLFIFAERFEHNIGFGRAFNNVAEEAHGDILYFVSNDVEISGDFITPVNDMIEELPRSLICHELIDFPSGWNQFGGNAPITYPAGHFIACTRDVWNELGGFDPRYYPHDYEDVDLGMTAKSKNIPLVRIERLPLRHMVAGTIGYNPNRMQNTISQRARFAEKWSLPNEPRVP